MRCVWEGRLAALAFASFAGDWLLRERLQRGRRAESGSPRPSRSSGLRAMIPERAACQSRPSRAPSVVSDALRARVFQQLARRNQAANAHGNAGDNGRGAENDAPCSCAFHGSLLSDVHCCLLDWMYLPCALPVTLCFSLCSARCSGFLLFATSLHAVLTFCFALRLRFPFRPTRAPSLSLAPPALARLRAGFGCSRRCLPCHRESRGSSRCPGEGTRPGLACRSARM